MTESRPEAKVRVSHLRLSDFRNHADLALDFAGRSVVLIGQNGVGKTNVLEALSLLAPGRGFRRATLAEMARLGGSGGFSVLAGVEGAFGAVRIGTGAVSGEPGRRILVDGEPQKASERLSDHLRLIWLVPAMDGLFTGSAADRRRFLDRLVLAVDPAHGRRVSAYEQAVASRNRLLEGREADVVWLDALETEIAATGVAVAAARRETVHCLARLIEMRPDGDGAFPRAAVQLTGEVDTALDGAAAADVEDWLRADLRAGRSRDRAAGRTLVGPHRSDLSVRHAEKDMPASASSTGEQKALLTGLVLAQAALVTELTGNPPVLLLDEVAAHLDARRRRALVDLIAALGVQAFMTGTDIAPFEGFSNEAEIIAIPDVAAPDSGEF
ncbi:DNA replication and repair protein RecF [uncultured Pleomorphomonas sp.]|uniref:DNA replication and repair protein RecF n=1 Tax=uncultured Pleomorphomonas sp. TaxID=442121 RepID=A0A212LJZ7_9HYPH|nr:DNA replication/repair protein RecF [uncultured Pleomorphomonas sp.]SCM77817.1 DNA replication and repair protein RecF [uncultured Pleomorphomonas sp.]